MPGGEAVEGERVPASTSDLAVDLRLIGRLVEGTEPAVIVTDLDGRITYWNAGAERLLGWPAEKVLHQSVEVISAASADSLTSEQIHRGLTRQASYTAEFALQVGEREPVPVLVTTSPILDDRGRATGTVAVLVDISDRVAAERDARLRATQMTAVAAVGELAIAHTSLVALLDSALRQAVQALDADVGTVFLVEDHDLRMAASVGLPSRLAGSHRVPFGDRSLAGYTLERDDPTVVEDLASETRFVPPPTLLDAGVVSGATAVMRVGGRGEGVIGVYSRRRRSFDADDLNVLRSIANVLAHAMERDRAHQHLSRIAITDELTGLPNRVLFLDRLEHALANLDPGSVVGVLYGDLDGFKHVNDALGHAAGDELLRAAATRLLDGVREGDTVARFGGDEFAVLCEGVADPQEAAQIAQALAAAVASEPWQVEGHEVNASISLGVVVSDGTDDAATLLRDADAAMYRAKSAGPGRVELFDEDLRGTVLSRLERTNELVAAIAEEQLVVHYQPEVAIRGTEVWAEALVRWAHPTRGLLPPSEFIDLAEETGLIVPLGQQVLVTAAEQLARWRAMGSDEAPSAVSVNVSARQLTEGDLVGLVADLTASLQLPAWSLWLELTETAILRDLDQAIATLTELKGLGVGVAIDDFGTGYSSLAYARKFPVDAFKIDRSFIAGMTDDPRDEGIVRATVSLAHSFGILSIAEGVEEPAQMEGLRRLGCDYAQGYLLCRPGPPEVIEAWVRTHRPSGR
jgi:diguanylate cyclase (GGDEF)-like protein/PAS domain S-box-containing protein